MTNNIFYEIINAINSLINITSTGKPSGLIAKGHIKDTNKLNELKTLYDKIIKAYAIVAASGGLILLLKNISNKIKQIQGVTQLGYSNNPGIQFYGYCLNAYKGVPNTSDKLEIFHDFTDIKNIDLLNKWLFYIKDEKNYTCIINDINDIDNSYLTDLDKIKEILIQMDVWVITDNIPLHTIYANMFTYDLITYQHIEIIILLLDHLSQAGIEIIKQNFMMVFIILFK